MQCACHVINNLPSWRDTAPSHFESLNHQKKKKKCKLLSGLVLFAVSMCLKVVEPNWIQNLESVYLLDMIHTGSAGDALILLPKSMLSLEMSSLMKHQHIFVLKICPAIWPTLSLFTVTSTTVMCQILHPKTHFIQLVLWFGGR